jgi:hypothetical protein
VWRGRRVRKDVLLDDREMAYRAKVTHMKQIQVYIRNDLRFTRESMDVTKADQLLREAIRNRSRIVEGALDIERDLVRMISQYFFKERTEAKDEFDDLILNTDFCTFSAKRKLIMHIINKMGLLEGAEKPKFDKMLTDVMNVRNAFTHGRLIGHDEVIALRFFQGNPQEKDLTDQHLEMIESLLRETSSFCTELSQKMGIKLDTVTV